MITMQAIKCSMCDELAGLCEIRLRNENQRFCEKCGHSHEPWYISFPFCSKACMKKFVAFGFSTSTQNKAICTICEKPFELHDLYCPLSGSEASENCESHGYGPLYCEDCLTGANMTPVDWDKIKCKRPSDYDHFQAVTNFIERKKEEG